MPAPTIQQLARDDTALMHALLDVFGEAFDERDVYGDHRPSAAYWQSLLAGESFIALVALEAGAVVVLLPAPAGASPLAVAGLLDARGLLLLAADAVLERLAERLRCGAG